MADTKLSALTELNATPAGADEIYIRDVSESASAESKRITVTNLVAAAGGGITINANCNNNLITATGTANCVQGEANLTFDGALLTSTASVLICDGTGYSNLVVRSGCQAHISIEEYAASASGSLLDLAHSRNATRGSHTAIDDNDVIGQIRFLGSNGSAYKGGANLRVVANQDFSGCNAGSRLEFYTIDNCSNTADLRLTVEHNGNLNLHGNDIIAPGAAKGYTTVASNGTRQANFYNVSATSLSSACSGDYTVTWTTDFANVNYAIAATAEVDFTEIRTAAPGVGSVRILIFNSSGSAGDSAFHIIAHGDQ